MTSQSSTKNGTGVTHLPECHYVKDTDNVQYGWNDCICPELRACEQRVLDAAEQALLRLEADMRNWSSDETRAATSASPELTAGNWIWAQHGVGRSVQIIHSLKETNSTYQLVRKP